MVWNAWCIWQMIGAVCLDQDIAWEKHLSLTYKTQSIKKRFFNEVTSVLDSTQTYVYMEMGKVKFKIPNQAFINKLLLVPIKLSLICIFFSDGISFQFDIWRHKSFQFLVLCLCLKWHLSPDAFNTDDRILNRSGSKV